MATIATTHPLLQLAQQLGTRLQQLEEVQRFRAAETQIDRSAAVKDYIEQIKHKQKELVHAKHFQKSQYIAQLEQELDQLQDTFNNLPIVQEYQQMQVGVNDLLQTIQDVIADTLATRLEVETGGEVASGCGSGGPCGCK
jgi:cell fate (sporulation/competence/biofilm development) regulator YmcA (YheA/YmcA/DUF963 family)